MENYSMFCNFWNVHNFLCFSKANYLIYVLEVSSPKNSGTLTMCHYWKIITELGEDFNPHHVFSKKIPFYLQFVFDLIFYLSIVVGLWITRLYLLISSFQTSFLSFLPPPLQISVHDYYYTTDLLNWKI